MILGSLALINSLRYDLFVKKTCACRLFNFNRTLCAELPENSFGSEVSFGFNSVPLGFVWSSVLSGMLGKFIVGSSLALHCLWLELLHEGE